MNPKSAGRLTSVIIKFLKPKDKRYEVLDIPGLYLRISTTGAKTWQMNKSINGKRVVKCLGKYPDISIAQARRMVQSYVSDTNSATSKNTFGNIFADWLAIKKQNILKHQDLQRLIELYLLPSLDKVLWKNISTVDLINVIKSAVPEEQLSTKLHLCSKVKEIERFAVNTGRTTEYKFQGILDAFPHHKITHYPSIRPEELTEFFSEFKKNTHYKHSKEFYLLALQLGFYTLLRPAEYLLLKWEYINFQKDLITIPAENMKMKTAFDVPLTKQLKQLLLEFTHDSEYVLPNFISNVENIKSNAKLKLSSKFKKISVNGHKLVPHGIRAIGRVWMSEHDIPFDVAENCLSHKVGNAVVTTYNRTTLLEKRREAMQKWCDYVESCIIASGLRED